MIFAYGIMFGKWAGASREETYGQSWDKYIFLRFLWFILIISSVSVCAAQIKHGGRVDHFRIG